MHPYEQRVIDAAAKTLVGRTIVAVRHMSETEAEASMWSSRPPVLVLDDGNQIIAMRDDEGNDGGAFATTYEGELETIAVIQ